MADYLSILIQAAEPAKYKLNYDEHYLLSVPLATTTTPGIASFDSDYFSVVNGVVSLSDEYTGNLNNIIEDVSDLQEGKVDKITPGDYGTFAYVVRKSILDGIVNSLVQLSGSASPNTLVVRNANGRIKIANGANSDEAVTLNQLTLATTDISETALSVAVRTKLNEGISRVGISPEAWEALPDADKDINTMYFVGPYGTAPNQYFVEWMYFVNNGTGVWEAIGSTQSVDLSNYFTKSEINALLANYYTKSEMTTKLSDYAKQNGYYPTMRVGLTDQIYTDREIEDADTACPPAVFGTVGGNAEVQSGLNRFEELRGNTIKWNQLCVTISQSFVLSADVTNDWVRPLVSYETNAPLIEGHKILVLSDCATTAISLSNQYTTVKLRNKITTVSSAFQGKHFSIYADGTIQAGQYNDVRFNIFDLTAIYGAGNEPSTADEFVRDFPMPYYAYNAGTLLSSKSSSVDFIKRNQWDEEWEQGDISSITGQPVSSSLYIRSKNFTRVLPSMTYFGSVGTGHLWVFYYDNQFNYISYTVGGLANTTFTTPSNCTFIKIGHEGTTYNHDICIYINWETPGLPYVPYSAQTVTLPNLELRSAGSAYDVLYQQGGGKRRVGTVDLGSLDWSMDSSQSSPFFYTSGLNGLIKKVTTYQPITPSKYELYYTGSPADSAFASGQDKAIALHWNGSASGYAYLYVKDTSYNDATAFKTAMSGVMLYYELATETDITLEENPGWTEYAEIDNFGTVKFNQSPAQDIPVPQAYFIRYTVNLVEFLDSLFVHCGGDVSKIALVSP